MSQDTRRPRRTQRPRRRRRRCWRPSIPCSRRRRRSARSSGWRPKPRRRSRGASRLLLVVCTMVLAFVVGLPLRRAPRVGLPGRRRAGIRRGARGEPPDQRGQRRAAHRALPPAAGTVCRPRSSRPGRHGAAISYERRRGLSARRRGRRRPGLVHVGRVVDAVHRQQLRGHRQENPMIRRRARIHHHRADDGDDRDRPAGRHGDAEVHRPAPPRPRGAGGGGPRGGPPGGLRRLVRAQHVAERGRPRA